MTLWCTRRADDAGRATRFCYHQRLLISRRFLVSGRVQGVGFRYFTQAAAARENVHGWVRNLVDGRVEASAEGDADAIDRFELALRHGPPGAQVEHLEIEHTVPAGRDAGFIITGP